jgi:hypothetical protein
MLDRLPVAESLKLAMLETLLAASHSLPRVHAG